MCKNELSARFIAAYEALLDNGKVTDKRDFALKIGISPSMVTEISKGRSNVGTLAIQNIVSLFDINAEWLLTGKGDMLKVSSTPSSPSIHQDTPQQKSVGLKIQKVEPSSGRGIPLIPLDAIAGFPVDPNESVYLENCERYVVPEFENKGANFLIRVSGDSMIPLYYSGDLIACRKSRTSASFSGVQSMSSKRAKAFLSSACRKAKTTRTAYYACLKTALSTSRSSFRVTTYAALAS